MYESLRVLTLLRVPTHAMVGIEVGKRVYQIELLSLNVDQSLLCESLKVFRKEITK